MKVLGIQIRSVGGIEQLAIAFDPHMNILCGPNGIGKTTVLESIAHCFTIGGTNVLKRHVGAQSSEICAEFEHERNRGSATIRFDQFEPNKASDLQGRQDLAPYILSLKTTRTFGYTPLNSVSKDTEKAIHVLWEEARTGVVLHDVKNWLVNRFLYSVHEGALNEDQLANFQLAKSCFSVLDDNISFLRVNASSNEILVSTPGGHIYYEYLSSGFKSCLAMMLGIIKEIEFRFPHSSRAESFAGIALIDELELHLHPQWQSKITKILTRIFPHIQFVVTTHSPHIIQSADPNQIVALEMLDRSVVVRELPASRYAFKGWTLDEVLTDIMGMPDTRSIEFLRLINLFNDAVERNSRADALIAYQELDASLHPSNHTRKLLRLQLSSLDDPEND